MTSQMDCGPWYEVVSMPHEEAEMQLFKVFQHKYTNHEQLKKIINEVVKTEKDLGSHRGYWTFLHTKFKQDIEEKIEYYNKKPS